MITIRKANINDLKEILKLIRKSINYHRKLDKSYRPFSKHFNLEKHVKKSLKNKNKLYFVAQDENNEKIIGYFIALIEKAPYSFTMQKYVGVIADAYIDPKYRKKGLGKKIFKEIIKWFKSRKIKYIELDVDARNKIGIKTWKKYGFYEFRMKMKLR